MMSELRKILDDMQSGMLDVDETIAKYEQGQALVGDLEAYLEEAKNTITQRKPEGV
jgi:exodeoxyribonuclease VII small subunit